MSARGGDGRGRRILGDAYPGRFGGTPVTSPLAQLTTYLDAMDATPPGVGAHPTPILLPALGPRMLGPDGLVAPRQAVMFCDDASTVRAAGRQHLAKYLAFPNYRRAWLRQGFDERDLDGEASDRLIDTMIAWGSTASILDRLAEHHDAGADHVAVHPLRRPGTSTADVVLELAASLPS